MTDSRRQLFNRLLRFLPYVGLLLVLLVLVDARRTTRESDQTLGQSVLQQRHLRNILWMNLLIQRSTGMAFTAKQVNDPGYLERAKTVADALDGNVANLKRDGGDFEPLLSISQNSATEFQGALERYAGGRQSAREFSATVDRIGAELNRIESEEWYRLNEHNQKLLADIKKDHASLLTLLAIFIAYLGLLGWTMSRKEKVEAALVDAEAKMLNSAKISALGEMAGGVAHEINNPLATIDLLTSQIREILAEKPEGNELPMEMLEKVGKTVKRISSIVQGLRIFSRDGSQDRFEVTPVSVVVESTLSLCQEKFKHADIAVKVSISPPDLAIECQQVQISQVILNLLNNACDAIQSSPKKWIQIEARPGANGVLIAVTDSGTGIPEAVAQKVFNPFFTTKEVGKGTGLGLSISKGIIDAHHGRISLDSRSPNTRFVIELPAPGKLNLPRAG